MKEAKDKCKAAGEPETRWAEFLDVDTLEQIAKGTFLTLDDLKLLRQSDEEQKKQLQKLQQDITNITTHLGSVLSLHPPAATPPAAPATPVTTGITSAGRNGVITCYNPTWPCATNCDTCDYRAFLGGCRVSSHPNTTWSPFTNSDISDTWTIPHYPITRSLKGWTKWVLWISMEYSIAFIFFRA